ncbi:Lissencephaly-1 [Tilletia horrida]|uniref:Nuclear distribution protein PAC1 n=1 Tax=Tilletia horrida TaxID=155126 RepID=A0AAN6JGG8_9BASI|nr:Lissencephaly-1 [Tilletia horrida]KAK0539052.1 Lissencephaly-1 [Tilletia horrida]
MTSNLSDRQRDELHKSILDYFNANGLTQSYEALMREAEQDGFVPDPKAKYAGLLEKKWTSVIRLQKKILDLEARNAQLTEELAAAPTSKRSASITDWVPRNPPRHTLSGHRQPLTRVAFHPLFSILVSASEDATMKVWDWEGGEMERTLKGHTKAVQDVDFDSKGQFLVSCSSDLSIKVWDTSNDWKNTKTLYGHDHSISSVRFMPGDDRIMSASRDRTIKLWDLASGYCTRTVTGHAEWVRAAIPSDDGSVFVTCSNDQVSAKDERSRAPNQFVATGSRDKTIRIWDASSGQCLRTLHGHDNWIRALVFHPNGKALLSASDDKSVKVWDLATGRCTRTLDAHAHFVTHLAWGRARVDTGAAPAPDGAGAANGNGSAAAAAGGEKRVVNVLATASVDLTVRIWTP